MRTNPLVTYHDLQGKSDSFAACVTAGLSATPKAIPCRFLYDERGSALFEAICLTPEYYPTRTEMGILQAAAPQIASLMGSGVQLVELGSGSSEKIRLLLDLLHRPAGYVAIDISGEHLRAAAYALAEQHPVLPVAAICGDYMSLEKLPDRLTGDYLKRVLFFPGSTIGNLDPDSAVTLLQNCARMSGENGEFLIGVDLKKDKAVLDAAYDDPAGVTAAFTLNLLDRMNRELGGSFDKRTFMHRAFYAPDASRVEIYIESRIAQTVTVAGNRYFLAAGERIHTEYSYKYSISEFQSLAARAGWRATQCWTDADKLFSVHYLRRD